MSEEDKQVIKINYEDFESYYNENPDLDNAEYYSEFPTVHKSTIRGWKVRARKGTEDVPPEEPTPAAPRTDLYDKEMVKILCNQAGVPLTDFEGVDTRSAIQILKNKLAGQQSQKPRGRGSNGPILPTPKAIGQNKKQFGIDPYIDFDLEKNEIRLEIPLDEVMDPVKNEKLRKIS